MKIDQFQYRLAFLGKEFRYISIVKRQVFSWTAANALV